VLVDGKTLTALAAHHGRWSVLQALVDLGAPCGKDLVLELINSSSSTKYHEGLKTEELVVERVLEHITLDEAVRALPAPPPSGAAPTAATCAGHGSIV